MTLSQAANKVIDLGRKIRAYYDVELPKRYPNYPLINPDLEADVPPPPEEMELEEFLRSLSDETIYQLHLIVSIGCEFAVPGDLGGKYEIVKESFGGNLNYAISRLMMDMTVLADQISDGLEELRSHNLDVDKLRLNKVRLRKR